VAGVVLTATVLAVTGVVLEHNAHRSTLLSKAVPDGPVYPIGMGPADAQRAVPVHTTHARRIRESALFLPPTQQTLNQQLELEEPEALPLDDVAQKMKQYAAMHPVYKRCAKKADLTAFNAAITKSCGNIHEIGTCMYTFMHICIYIYNIYTYIYVYIYIVVRDIETEKE